MNCESSMTPPSSDDEYLKGVESSPVLKRKKRKKCSTETENVQKINLLSNSNEKILENEVCKDRIIVSSNYFSKAISDDKWNEKRINQLYSKVMFQLREMERRCDINSPNSTELFGNDLVYSDLKELYKFIDNRNAISNKSLMTEFFNYLLNISSECIYLLHAAKPQLLRFYKSKKHCYGESSSLHLCTNSLILQIYHLFCEVHSSLLDVTFQAFSENVSINKIKIYNENELILFDIRDILVQFSDKIVQTLSELAFHRFNNEFNQTSGNSVLQSLPNHNPYPCSCFNELPMKCFNKFKEELEFWSILIKIVDDVVINSRNESKSYQGIRFKNIETSLSFCWWWFHSMATKGMTIFCHLVTRLVRLSLVHSRENALSYQLIVYKSIFVMEAKPLTQSNFAEFRLMWMDIVTNLHSSVEKSQSGIEKFTVKDRNVTEWIVECRNVKKCDSNSSPLHVILGILSLFVEDKNQWNNVNENYELLSQIEISAVAKLTEPGIDRLFTVALTILMTFPSRELNSFLVEFLKLMEHCVLAKTDYRKQNLCITGYFSLLQICSERKVECVELEEKIRVLFKRICRLFADKDSGLENRKEYFKAFVFFLQHVIYYFQTTNSEKLSLLNKHVLGSMLKEMREKEGLFILNLISKLVVCLRRKKSQNKMFLTQLEDMAMAIFIWLKRLHLNNDENTLDLILEISLITMNKSSNFSLLLKYFASAGKSSLAVRADFLARILSQIDIVAALDNDYTLNKEPELCDAVMQGWAQCSVVNETESLNSYNFTVLNCVNVVANCQRPSSLMENLKIVKDLFVTTTTRFTLKNLLDTIGERYNSSKNFIERVGWASKLRRWFTSKVVDCAVTQLRSKTIFTSRVSLFSQFALIFEKCSHMLHIEGKSSFISYAIDCLLINFWQEAESPSKSLLQATLNQFVVGILSAGGTRSTSLRVKLKTVIDVHMTRWPTKQQADNKTIPHPFVSLLKSHPNVEHKNYFVSLLLEHAQEKSTPETLYVLVEIIHVWVETKLAISSFAVFHQCLPILQQARLQFRFDKIMQDKIQFLIKNIRGLT